MQLASMANLKGVGLARPLHLRPRRLGYSRSYYKSKKPQVSQKTYPDTRFRLFGGESLSLHSPSKINLFLRIVRRRDDGYHDLASLFHVIDLGDPMDFELLPGSAKVDELECNVPDIPVDDSNLVIKALNLFRHKTNLDRYFGVRLDKVVPHGAGMGGGSGNAATALWAANELCGRPASTGDLLEWSADIGSDISVFFSEGAAYCTGRGEIVENLEPPVDLGTPILLVKPSIGLSTPQIFRSLDLERTSSQDPKMLLSLMTEHGIRPEYCVNDLEEPAFMNLPALGALKERLQRESNGRFSAVFMTGSGSTIVCIGSDEPPEFLQEDQYADVFISPARLLVRMPGEWYKA